MTRRRSPWHGVGLAAAGIVWLTSSGPAQENLGVSQQALVGAIETDVAMQEAFGLMRLTGAGGTCSASLLRNQWAITAAHCVEVDGPDGKPIPDPARPGQNVIAAPDTFSMSVGWRGPDRSRVGQRWPAVQVETFRPYDVAIIKLANPIMVGGSTARYSRLIFQDGQFPYFGEPVGANLLAFGRGINKFATGSGATATPSVMDGLYRRGGFKPGRNESNLYWFPSGQGAMVAGGDSGGPSFAWTLGGYALVGVHALSKVECVSGMTCGNWKGPGPVPEGYDPWRWVSATPESADAPIAPVWAKIQAIMGPAPPVPSSEPALTPPPPGFIGTFGTTPKNYQPMWVYGILPNGHMMWYRKDTGTSPWQGPKRVGAEWNTFKNVIAAGGNSFYALTQDNQLVWYQHTGFNDGARIWKPAVTVGRGWGFSKIFSGGDGVVYAVRADGVLIWYRHDGYANGGGPNTWSGGGAPKIVGTGWGGFKDLFSTGQGSIYAVGQDGSLLLYKHTGYGSGANTWGATRTVGAGWNAFRQVVPVGDGVMLAVKDDGKLLWYKHHGRVLAGGASSLSRVRYTEKWEGPVEIGSGWHSYGKVVAIIPATSGPIVR